jgi:hypothetical protein
VPSTQIQLVFRVWGPRLDPELLTAQTGTIPSRIFQVGELKGAAANVVAGWEWRTGEGSDDEPMVREMLDVLSPHAGVFRACRDEGADIWLSAVGTVGGDLIDTPEQAQQRRWHVSSDTPFEPILDVDRVGLGLSAEAIRFLADVGASFETHIDAVYEPFDA